jgi:membrane-bound lytic murein transglycosylase B
MQRYLAIFLCALCALPQFASAETDAEKRARIEAQLQQVEKQMLIQQQLVEVKQEERQSLERDLDILDAQVRKAQLGIQARALAISSLTDQIGDKEELIEILNYRLDKQKISLAELLRQTEAVDDYSLVEVLLSNESFSDFFADVESFRSVKKSLNDSLQALAEIKLDAEGQKSSLLEKQQTEAELKAMQELEKKTIESREKQKEQILHVTKGEEQAYQELLASQQKTAAQLRNALFQLLGGSGAIPFPEAVALATYAGTQTGVSPALLLAVVEQESNYGSNLGSCLVGDIQAGKSVMHPERDAPVFLAIANILGFDAATQKVSCAIIGSNGNRIGWGGAMGPLQFIPSTWAVYGGIVNNGSGWVYDKSRDAIRSLTGGTAASNPFNKQDAFMASALLLRDNGATGSYASDRLAALRYYAGWGGATRAENQFYGDQVMERKARLEGEIKTLDGG